MLLTLLALACHWITPEEHQARLDPDGDGAELGYDCAPDDATIFPGADEVCDGVDNDCDGEVDEDPLDSYFRDADGDGHGDRSQPIAACAPPSGYVASDNDCDDLNAAVSPSAEELCNGVDDDCDGEADGPDASDAATWYLDADRDGYGVDATSTRACEAPEGFTDNAEDCDDSTASVNPGRDEVCNDGVDNNCDDSADPCALSGELPVNGDVVLQGAHGLFGATIAAGDFDGDGVSDLAVGAPQRGNNLRGEVFTFLGPITADRAASDAPSVRGLEANANLGVSLVTLGDVDGDGADDLLMGADQASNLSGFPGAGATWLLSGAELETATLTDAIATFYGAFGYDGAGAALTPVGDRMSASGWASDGVTDLLIGAPDFDSTTHINNGELCLFSGDSQGDVSHQTARMCLYGASDRDALGAVLAPLPDFAADGATAVFAGTPSRGAGGSAWIITDPGRSYNSVANVDAIELIAQRDGDQLGATGADAGDVNGDGHPDLLIGAPRHDGGGLDAGAVYLVLGDPTLPESGAGIADLAEVTYIGESDGDLAGASVAGVGDVDGDGFAELLIGSPNNSTSSATGAGRAYLIYGPPSSTGGVDLSTAEASFDGVNDFDAAGSTVAPAGDVNGDGRLDLAIGAPQSDEVYIIFGLGI